MTPWEQYNYDNYYGMGDDFYAGRKINNDVDLIWQPAEYPDEYYSEVMDTMYIPAEEAYNGQRTIDVSKLNFQYTYMDIQAAARAKGKRRKDFIIKEDINGADVFHYALNFGGWGPEIAHMQSLMMCREENLSGKEFQIRTAFLQNFEAGKEVQFTGIIEEISRDGLVLSNCYLSEN